MLFSPLIFNFAKGFLLPLSSILHTPPNPPNIPEMKQSIPSHGAPRPNIFIRVWRFYADGFRSMTVGRYLWAMILFKLVVFFLIFRLIFFPNILKENYDSDEERAEAVRTALTSRDK